MAEKEFAPFSESSEKNSVGFPTPSVTVGEPSNINNEELVMPISPQGGAPSKKPRGRPKGSKNKPKAPVVIMVEPESFMEHIVIEVPAGHDVVESIINSAQRHQADISVLRGYGLVTDITIRSTMSPNSPQMTIKKLVRMMNLSGTYVNPNYDIDVPSQFITNPDFPSFRIYLNGNQGQVYTGIVVGKLMAASVVFITATLLKKPKFFKAPPKS